MPNPWDLAPLTHNPNELSLAQSHADLYAHPSFRIRQDHANHRLYVAGFVGNRGNVPPYENAKVALGVTLYKGSVTNFLSMQKVYTMGANIRPGDLALTLPELNAPLVYYNDTGWWYRFELLVDFNHDVFDMSRGNNYTYYDWWGYNALLLTGDEPVTFGNIDDDLAADKAATAAQSPTTSKPAKAQKG